MSTTPQSGPPKATAPYVPFKSFMTALDYLRQGLPHNLDRSAWPTFSGGLAGQMLATFQFLGFLDEDYASTSLLQQAVDPDRRKDAVAHALNYGYKDLIELDLARATPKQLADLLGELYNVSGATHKKAMTFFLHAAKYIDLALSPAISRKTRSSGPRRRKAPNLEARFEDGLAGDASDNSGQPIAVLRKRGSSKTISLRGGGSATVSFDVDVWEMTPEDQSFVFGMIKVMNDYEKQNSPKDPAK